MRPILLLLIIFCLGERYIAFIHPSFADEGSAGSTELAESIDLRPELKRLGFVQRCQERRGTCSVFATVEAVEFAYAKQVGESASLSVEFANWAANESTGRKDDGDFFHNIIKGIQKHGLCFETEMPYENDYSPDRQPSETALQQATEFRDHYRVQFHWLRTWKRKPGLIDYDLQRIKRVLASGYPVSAGSYHSVLLVGYEDDVNQPGGGRFWISDSNLHETEIDYAAAKDRFCDLFWVELARADGSPDQRIPLQLTR